MEIQSIKFLKVLNTALLERKKKLEEYVQEMNNVFVKEQTDSKNTEIFNEIVKFHNSEIEIIIEILGGIKHETDKSNIER